MADPGSYRIRTAQAKDADAVYQFGFANPDPHLAQKSPEDIAGLIRHQTLQVAEVLGRDGWEIVGTASIKAPDDGHSEWEIGAAYIREGHRKRGLIDWLGAVALGNLVAAVNPIARKHELVAHVLVDNDDPRPALQRNGFVIRDHNLVFDPSRLKQLSHMKPSKDGLIHADVFVFPPAAYLALIDKLIAFDGKVGKPGEEVALALTSLPLLDPQKLLEMREQLLEQLKILGIDAK